MSRVLGTRISVVPSLTAPRFRYRDWDRIHRANKLESVLLGLRRPFAPMAAIWQASIDGTLDPRTFRDPPLIIDVVAPLLGGHSKAPVNAGTFHTLTRHLLEQR